MRTQSEFFHAVLPAVGIFCIAVKKPDQPGWTHLKFDNISRLISRLSSLRYADANYYFAISTFGKQDIVVGGTKRFRTQTNALETRCLILDIDVRPNKPGYYDTKEEGLADIQRVIPMLGLPQPIIVDSGFGYHVYWPMASGIPSTEWTNYARAFRNAVSLFAPKLVADASRVSDSAGILRVPGSYNLKGNSPTPVQICQWSDEVVDLAHLRTVLNVDGGQAIANINEVAREELPPVELATTAKNCNWLRTYIKTQGEASEPAWYAVLGLANYMFHDTKTKQYNGEDIAKLLSKGHPAYSEEATSIKFAQVRTNQTGPTTCAKFQSINPAPCAGCPFSGAVKSPVQTGRLARPAEAPVTLNTHTRDDQGNATAIVVTIPLPPKPYFRGENGGVYLRVKDPQAGDSITCIYDYDFYPTKRYRTELVESEQLDVHCWLPKDGLRRIKIPTEYLADHKKLNVFLSGKGVLAKAGGGQKLAKYMIDYARFMQTQESAEVEFARFGWRDTGTSQPRFVVSDGYYDCHGSLTPASFANFLKDASPATSYQGSANVWREGFDVYNRIPGSEAFQLATMLGFAAPLLALTEYSGVLYNMVGASAAGKSTALKFMTSVWGKPDENHIKDGDTIISMYNFIGYLSSIPVALDELTKMDGDKLSDFVLTFTGGRGKMRATREGQNAVNNVKWDTIVASTSNTSLYDKLSAARTGYNAESMRVFEVHVPESHDEFKGIIDQAIIKVRDNYGYAGREFIQYVIPRTDIIRKMVDAATVAIVRKGNIRNEERFWAVLLACVHVGGSIAGTKLKLHSYNMNRLLDWALGSVKDARDTVRVSMSDSATILGEFFNANIDTLIRINNNCVDLTIDGNKPRMVKARIEAIQGVPQLAYISVMAMREYCTYHKIDFAWLRRELKEAGVLLRDSYNKRLAAGTKLLDHAVRSWEVNLAHEHLAGVAAAVSADPEREPGAGT